MQDAILRNLQVLCESAQRLSGECKAQHQEVVWRAMSGFRNVLVHDYFGIDFGVVWSAVERDIPAFEAAVTDLLFPLWSGFGCEAIVDHHFHGHVAISGVRGFPWHGARSVGGQHS